MDQVRCRDDAGGSQTKLGFGQQHSHPIADMSQLDASIALAGASRELIVRVDCDTFIREMGTAR